MRVVFMGTPDFAVPTLSESWRRGTRWRPSIPSRRGRPAAAWASASRPCTPSPRGGPSVRHPAIPEGRGRAAGVRPARADVAVVVAYGLILPKPVLEAPARTAASTCMLRRCRAGAAPHRSSVPSWPATARPPRPSCAWTRAWTPGRSAWRSASIGPDMTAGELHDLLSGRGARLMVRALADLERGTPACTPQAADGVTYAAKIGKDETGIDFTRPAREVHNHVRGLSPVPGAWLEVARRQARAHQGSAHALAAGNRPGAARDGPRRRADHCLRRGRGPRPGGSSAPASGR